MHVRFIVFMFIMAVVILIACFWPYDAQRLDLSRELAPPSWAHPLGCGDSGVDLLAVSTNALLRSLVLALSVASIAAIIGTIIGAFAGYRGGWFAEIAERICDFTQAFPSFVLALGVLATIEHSTRWHIALVLLITAWAPFSRLALAELRSLRTMTYIEAATALGAPKVRIFCVHILPAMVPIARAQLGSTASALLLSDAALSFLGVGTHDNVTLGALIDQGLGSLIQAPHVLFVGSFTLIAASLLVQQVVDPKRIQ